MIKKVYAVFLGFVLFGCGIQVSQQTNLISKEQDVKIPKREYSVQSVLWVQQSAEYKALCYQAFNLAKYRIDEIVSEINTNGKPLAIVTDIDETILDNSPFGANQIIADKEYSEDIWKQWVELEKAAAIPGALEFFKYVESKGIQIYYISNRSITQEKETINNLKKVGFPLADNDHILLKEETSGKETRRQIVTKNNHIVMLLGDNLSDFADLFDNKSTIERNKIAKNLKEKFGKEFIVLPNPTYGDWETKGIYERNYKWSAKQKDSIRKAKLITY